MGAHFTRVSHSGKADQGPAGRPVIAVAQAVAIIGAWQQWLPPIWRDRRAIGLHQRCHGRRGPYRLIPMTPSDPRPIASPPGVRSSRGAYRGCTDCRLHVSRMQSGPFGFTYSLAFGAQTDHRPALVWTHAQVRKHLRDTDIPRRSYITGWRSDHRFGAIEISASEAGCLLHVLRSWTQEDAH